MTEPTMQVIREMTMRAHTLQRSHAAELTNAANHREHGDYTRAQIAAHTAQTCTAMAAIYQQAAGVLSGTWLPDPDEVAEPGKALGICVGIVRWGPPDGASVAELHQWKAFTDWLHQVAMRQKYLCDDAIKAANATQTTGQIAPEDLPRPDPLTSSPADESGSHVVVTRPAQAVLPADVEPDAFAGCGACGLSLVQLDGVWLHSLTLEPVCASGSSAQPVEVTLRVPEPEPERGTTREASLQMLGSLRRNKQDGSDGRPSVPGDPVPYPTQPAGQVDPAQVDPAQARLEELAAQLRDPSARQAPPSHGSSDPTQALPHVNGDGGAS